MSWPPIQMVLHPCHAASACRHGILAAGLASDTQAVASLTVYTSENSIIGISDSIVSISVPRRKRYTIFKIMNGTCN